MLPKVGLVEDDDVIREIYAVMRLGAKAYWTKSDYTPERVADELTQLWKDRRSKEPAAK